MDFPDELKYTEEHVWVSDDGGLISIGVTEFAQEQLGAIVFAELPSVGTRIDAGRAFGVLESVKSISDIYAPIDGEVVEVNDELPDSPETVNTSPYDDGWMIRVKADASEALDELMTADEYLDFIGDE